MCQLRSGAVVAGDLIYAIPLQAHVVLVVDVFAGALDESTLGTVGGQWAWQCGVLGADGRVYAIPSFADDVLVIDAPAYEAAWRRNATAMRVPGRTVAGAAARCDELGATTLALASTVLAIALICVARFVAKWRRQREPEPGGGASPPGPRSSTRLV